MCLSNIYSTLIWQRILFEKLLLSQVQNAHYGNLDYGRIRISKSTTKVSLYQSNQLEHMGSYDKRIKTKQYQATCERIFQ